MSGGDVLERLSTLSLSPATENALGLSIDLDLHGRQGLLEQGLWWIQPLFRGPQGLGVGLALLPDTPLEQAPVLLYKKGVACTVAATSSRALALLVYRLRLIGIPDAWTTLCTRWDELRADLRALATALGDVGSLEALREVARREDWLSADDEQHADHDARAEARRAIMTTLDPSDEHRRYRAWLVDAMRGQASGQAPDDLGAWARQAEVSAFYVAQEQMEFDGLMASAWHVVRGGASLDTSQAGRPSHMAVPVSIAARGTVHEAADELLRCGEAAADGIREHPVYAATMLMLEEGHDYDGMAHMRAAALLDESAHPAAAYSALLSASFWSYTRLGAGFRPAAQAAHLIARTQGWPDIARRLAVLGVTSAPG